MTRQTFQHRVPALVLAAALTASCTVPAAAEPIRDGVTPTYDEAYYATLDYYGNLLEGSVVKSYALNGADSLTDYGTYDEVVNLTDRTAAVQGEGETSFQFSGAAPDRFYFEGKTRQPFQDLPWTVTLRYTLNGVPAKAEDLAGQQGVVEILLDIVPNENAGDYARYNYTLEAMALFNQDDILSLEAPGAQVQLVGNLRTVLFLALPGEEQHFTIRVGSNDFSFGGLTVLMVPATLAQLEEIAKLSQRKDDLEDDYNALSGSLDNLLDALNNIQNGLYASAKGLDQLDVARQTFAGGKGVLYEDTDLLRSDLSNLADILEPVQERVQILSQTVTDSTTVLNELTDTTLTLQTQLAELENALRGLEEGTDDVKHVVRLAANLEDSLLSLERALGGTHISGGSISTNSSALVKKVKDVHGVYAADDPDAFFAGMLALQGKSQAEIQGIQNLLGIDESTAAAIGKQEEWKTANAAKKQMDGLHAAKENGMSFQGFCEQLPGVSESQAKQMNDLWIIYSSGGNLNNSSGGSEKPPQSPAPKPEEPKPEEPKPEPPAPENPAPEPSEDTETPESPENPDANTPEPEEPDSGQADAGKTQGTSSAEDGARHQISDSLLLNDPENGGESGGDSSESSGSEGDDSPSEDNPPSEGNPEEGDTPAEGDTPSEGNPEEGDTPAEGDTPGEDNPDKEDEPKPPDSGGSDQTVGGAVMDIITSGIDNATAQIDRIQSSLTNSLNEIKGPAATVAGNLADVCAQLNTLIPLLDDAGDVSAALRQSSETLRTLLTSVDNLRGVLNGYEPVLQEALANAGTLSASAAATIRDTETLLANAENLAQSTGAPLDEGTRQSLRGLSSALRQTAKALATTGEVKTAKNTITDIIEDTWNEYTGDINNLLLMDATAEPVSLTDERNPTPSSVQVLIRTQEIKTDEAEKEAETAAEKPSTTFWDRVSRMFQDFWQAIAGIFR